METNKKRPRYPTKEELDDLVDRDCLSEFESRVRYLSYDNLIAEVKERQVMTLNRDVFFCIMLHMDIRTLLDLSPQIPEVAILLVNDLFWRRKLNVDFPEVHCGTFDPDSIEARRRFENQPWRRLYNVVRFIMHRVVYQMISTIIISSGEDTLYSMEFNYIKEYPFFERRILCEKNKLQYGKPKRVTIAYILGEIVDDWDPKSYLPLLLQDFIESPECYAGNPRDVKERNALNFLVDMSAHVDSSLMLPNRSIIFRDAIAKGGIFKRRFDGSKVLLLG